MNRDDDMAHVRREIPDDGLTGLVARGELLGDSVGGRSVSDADWAAAVSAGWELSRI